MSQKILIQHVCICLSCVVFVLIWSSSGFCRQLSPSQTVDMYAQADYEGIRISYGDYLSYPTTRLLSWYGVEDGTEGGYDEIFVINGYKILLEKIESDQAQVEIEYDIICIMSAPEVEFMRKKETENVELVKVNNEWRLLYPIVPPRVSIDAAIKDARSVAASYKKSAVPQDQKTYKQHMEAAKRLEQMKRSKMMSE